MEQIFSIFPAYKTRIQAIARQADGCFSPKALIFFCSSNGKQNINALNLPFNHLKRSINLIICPHKTKQIQPNAEGNKKGQFMLL